MTDVEPRPDYALYRDPADMTYDELINSESVISVRGSTQVDKLELIGVPHVITNITYWWPNMKRPDGSYSDFVSIEAVVASERDLDVAIRRQWIPGVTDIAAMKVEPNERIVYNDGSTGIRRQLTMLLDAVKLVEVGGYDAEHPNDDSRFDRAWNRWIKWYPQTRKQNVNNEEQMVPSFSELPDGRPLIVRCRRGLRASDYTNDYGNATTFYLS